MIKRRDSRETAFTLLFEWSFKDDTLDEIIENAGQGRDLAVDPFAYRLASMTIDNCADLDKTIQRHSQKWKLGRLSRATLAILRLSVCEVTLMEDVPVGASINEAVELSKKFSTDDEAAFVNGVLGGLARELEGGNAPEMPLPDPNASVFHPQPGDMVVGSVPVADTQVPTSDADGDKPVQMADQDDEPLLADEVDVDALLAGPEPEA